MSRKLPSETIGPKPTTQSLVSDAVAVAWRNVGNFLLVGGLLILTSKAVKICATLVALHFDELSYSTLEWPVFFVNAFLFAQFAIYVHRHVLFGKKSLSISLDQTFLLFFAAVLTIDFAFIIPDEIIGSFFPGFLNILPGEGAAIDMRIFLEVGIEVIVSVIVLFLIAPLLTAPVHIVERSHIGLGVNIAIGKALYWQITCGVLLLQILLNAYAFFVGIIGGYFTSLLIKYDYSNYVELGLVVHNLLFAPLSFLTVLLGATFTSAVYLRGVSFLGIETKSEI